MFDISDPLNPTRIDVVSDSGFAYWHSATFNDGTKVLFTDEWGGGTLDTHYDPLDWGADAIYDIVDGKLVFKSYFKIPAPQLEQENCVAQRCDRASAWQRPLCRPGIKVASRSSVTSSVIPLK